MKNRIQLLVGLFLLLSCSYLSCNRSKNKEPAPPEESFTLYSDPGLSPLISNWAGIYGVLNPDMEIQVVDVTSPDVFDDLQNTNSLGFFNNSEAMSRFNFPPWKEVVGREVIVMVMNSDNPYEAGIATKGVSPEVLGNILTGEDVANWSQIVGAGEDLPIHFIMVDHASIPATLAGYFGSDQIAIQASSVKEKDDLIAAVEGDAGAIGICRLTDIIDPAKQSFTENVQLLPLDLNGNGELDHMESIYTDLNTFSRGVWIGKYPRSLVTSIYSVSASQPEGEMEVAFLKWILSNGQALLDNYGFTDLEANERLAKARIIDNYRINPPDVTQAEVYRNPLFSNIYFLGLLVLFAIILLMTIAGILVRERTKGEDGEGIIVQQPVINEQFIRSPQGLLYDRSHTWAFMDEEGMVKIGIDDFLQHVTGTLTNVKLRSPGELVRKGKHVFSIAQDGKQLDICAPVSGTIKEVNPLLKNQTSLLNKEPYKNGWVYKIEPTNWMKEIKFLITGKNYKNWIQNEITRLKEFFTLSIRPETSQYANVLQDGGDLSDGLLEQFGPVIWEDFQTHFLDELS